VVATSGSNRTIRIPFGVVRFFIGA
jgi:hypothetical protein